MNRPSDVRRGESSFYISRGNPHGGRGGCASGDHGDWIAVVIKFKSNSEVVAHLVRRGGTEPEKTIPGGQITPGVDLFKQDLIFWKVRSGESPCELEVRRVIKR